MNAGDFVWFFLFLGVFVLVGWNLLVPALIKTFPVKDASELDLGHLTSYFVLQVSEALVWVYRTYISPPAKETQSGDESADAAGA